MTHQWRVLALCSLMALALQVRAGSPASSAKDAAAAPIVAVPWAPPGISSPQFESHGAFDPLRSDFYFVRSSPKFEGWRILVSHCGRDVRKDLDIWRVDRAADGHWLKPERLPEPVNSTAQEWFPRLGPDGWLYFGSGRADQPSLGQTDLWRARQDAHGKWPRHEPGQGDQHSGCASRWRP